MGNNKAETAVTSRWKQNYIHINYRIIILQTEIRDTWVGPEVSSLTNFLR